MLAKLILVMWLHAGRSDMQVQYIVRMPSEAACMAEAKKIEDKNSGGWNSYPVQHATCVFDATSPNNPPK